MIYYIGFQIYGIQNISKKCIITFKACFILTNINVTEDYLGTLIIREKYLMTNKINI